MCMSSAAFAAYTRAKAPAQGAKQQQEQMDVCVCMYTAVPFLISTPRKNITTKKEIDSALLCCILKI